MRHFSELNGSFEAGRVSLLLIGGWLLVLGICGCGASRPAVPSEPYEGVLEVHWVEPGSGRDGERSDPPVEEAGALSLEQVVREALEASPELDQMRQRIHAASEQVRQAEASFFPRLVVSEDFSITSNPVFAAMNIINQRRLLPSTDFNDPGAQQDFATKLQGEMMLFQGGSRWFDRKAALAQKGAAGAELRTGRNQLVAKAAEVYYQWLQALAFIGVAERALDAARIDLELGEARLRAEVVLPSEVTRLKARRAEMEGNLVTARSGARKLQAALERLIARPIREAEMPSSSLSPAEASVAPPGVSREELVRQALARRPEMAAVKSLVDASTQRVRSARGGFLPRLGATGAYQWNTEKWDDVPNSWLLGIQATWPVFEGGLTLSRMREAQARLKEMEARGKQVALDIALEVHQAAMALHEAAEKIRVMSERRTYAQEALEEVRRLYERQVVTVEALLQAELAWTQAEVAFMASLFDGRIAQAYLRRSLGDFADKIDG
ncbi:MAG: TolC family protein [Syntrophobacteraceae bacterium]|nr:TolC family protein [Syntrophobacteraceae bacterium]